MPGEMTAEVARMPEGARKQSARLESNGAPVLLKFRRKAGKESGRSLRLGHLISEDVCSGSQTFARGLMSFSNELGFLGTLFAQWPAGDMAKHAFVRSWLADAGSAYPGV